MLNSSKRSRLARVGEFVKERGGGARIETEATNRVADLRALVTAQQTSVEHLQAMRAEPLAKRLAVCGPSESAERIFGDMALDLRIIEERRKLKEWRAELQTALEQQRNRRLPRTDATP